MKKELSMPNFINMEESVIKFWEDQNIFNKLRNQNAKTGKYFRFLDGPITANNAMGVHHAWGRSLKDIILRYKAMNGYASKYQNGFDAQGLWVEVETEKELGLKDKLDIEKLGLDKFTNACMDRVKKYSNIIIDQSKRLGQWMDWENSYYTNSDTNITSIWQFLNECNNRGWLVQKYRPMAWCSHCGTSLSDHEVADTYKDMEHTAVFIKLPIANTNYDILVWTTTPWTLVANVAIAVNPEFNYSICNVKSSSRKLIVCSSRIKVLKDDLLSVEKEVKGSELCGLTYETCFNEINDQQFEHKIVAWDQVLLDEGSGAVHIATGCGVEDFELGQSINLPNICPVDENGIYYNNFGFLSGKNVAEVAEEVFQELEKRGKLYYKHKHTHRYRFCWRCKEPLIYRLSKEWYLKVDEIKPLLKAVVETVEWQPEFLKKRMLDWLDNMSDWNISRKRFYGLPLPFYPCEHCGKLTVIKSKEELIKLSSKESVDKLPHLHRPFIDEVEINCPECGHKVKRVKEVGDCWLDAGITPFSTNEYFTNKKEWKKNFPSEIVVEMREQIRLWFYSLLFMSVTLTGKAPYKKVIGFASLVAEDGSKFSKSGKNNISFFDAANKIGSDVIRYMFASNNMLNDTRFGYAITDDLRRKLLGLWNAYVFFNTYAVLDNPKLDGFKPNLDKLDISDKWLIQKTDILIKVSKEAYDNQQFSSLVKEFESYSDDLSNWYIRVNRRRFWKSEDEEDKLHAYYSLYYALKNVAKVMAPIIPFMSEHIWQNLVRELEINEAESIFLSSYPVESKFDFSNLIDATVDARDIITIAQRLRNENQIKIKQPLKTMFLCVNEKVKKSVMLLQNIIKEELNIKEIIFENDSSKFNESYLIVNFKSAGTVLKGEVQKLKIELEKLTETEMQEKVKEFESGKISINSFGHLDSTLFIKKEKAKTDYVISTENNKTVVLDITLDVNLMLEGLYRELVRTLQVLRKEANFKVEDRINLQLVTTSDTLQEVIIKFKDKIVTEALVKNFENNLINPTIEKTVEVGGESLTVKMSV